MTRSRTNPLLSPRSASAIARSLKRGGVGVVLVKKINLLTNTTPSAPSTVASLHSIDGADTPPRLRRGIRVSPKVVPQEISGFQDLRCRNRPISKFPDSYGGGY